MLMHSRLDAFWLSPLGGPGRQITSGGDDIHHPRRLHEDRSQPGVGYRAATLEVIDAITSDALPNAASRSLIWWRLAIHRKSV